MEKLIELGQKFGLSGQPLLDFVKEREDEARKERIEARDAAKLEKEKEIELAKLTKEKELEVLEKQIALEKIKKENEGSSKSEDRKSKTDDNRHSLKSPKLPHFVDGKDNMDAYLERFERFAKNREWPKDSWAIYLGALLQGKALDVYSRLSSKQADNYDDLKQALLKRFQMSAEDFQHKFRTTEPETGESARQYVVRLEHYFDRWLELTETKKTFDGVRELVVKQQFLEKCGTGLSVFLKEPRPKTLKELTEMAEVYIDAHGRQMKFPRRNQKPGANQNRSNPETRNEKQSSFNASGSKPMNSTHRNSDKRIQGNCYICNKPGHRAKDCWYRDKTQTNAGFVDEDRKPKKIKWQTKEKIKQTRRELR